MKLKLLGCPSLRRELFLLASLSAHEVDVELLPSPVDTEQLQKLIDCCDGYDYILPCVGSCLSEGLTATGTALILPRAHDCAHLLLGGTERYRRIFSENDDEPRWDFFPCSLLNPSHGVPCTIRNTLFDDAPKTENANVREYAADLSLLRSYIGGYWDERFLRVDQGERVVSDPVEILCIEPGV